MLAKSLWKRRLPLVRQEHDEARGSDTSVVLGVCDPRPWQSKYNYLTALSPCDGRVSVPV